MKLLARVVCLLLYSSPAAEPIQMPEDRVVRRCCRVRPWLPRGEKQAFRNYILVRYPHVYSSSTFNHGKRSRQIIRIQFRA